jgi:hypothetical protein
VIRTVFFALFVMLTIASATAQKEVFLNTDFESFASKHKTIAVLPFAVDLALKAEPSEFLRRQFLETEGLAVQQALANYFENKSNSKNFSILFQPLALTQKKLQNAGIDYRSIGQMKNDELAKVLEVDALITGTLQLQVLLSDGIEDEFNWFDLWVLSTEFGKLAIKVSDGSSGKLLWRYEKAIDRRSGKNTKELIEKLMKQAARSFPYYNRSSN